MVGTSKEGVPVRRPTAAASLKPMGKLMQMMITEKKAYL
jgi:hypothetical protein